MVTVMHVLTMQLQTAVGSNQRKASLCILCRTETSLCVQVMNCTEYNHGDHGLLKGT